MTTLFDALYQEPEDETDGPVVVTGMVSDTDLQRLTQVKPGPVVTKRKRQGLQLCNVFNPAKPPKWAQVVLEPKVDGYRCLARVENGKASLLTSTQMPFGPNVRVIVEQLERAAAQDEVCDNFVLDGEIVHETLPFDIAGGVLRLQTPDDRAEGMRFIVWDLLALDDFDHKMSDPLLERKANLQEVCRLFGEVSPPVDRIVRIDHLVGTIAQVDSVAQMYLEQGYEGIVLKDADGYYCYGGKAGTNWLKWKPFREGDFRITGAVEGRGKHVGRLGAIKVHGYLLMDGNIQPDFTEGECVAEITGEAGTGQALNDKGREQMWAWHQAGTLVGRCAEIRYQDISSENSLRFPRLFRLRPDKDAS